MVSAAAVKAGTSAESGTAPRGRYGLLIQIQGSASDCRVLDGGSRDRNSGTVSESWRPVRWPSKGL